MASIISTTFTTGTVMINPLNGSEILSINMNIVLLKSCSGIARLILFQLNFIQLGAIHRNTTIDAGIIFKGSTANYKSEVFLTDFDGYPNNGSSNYGFHSWLQPITLSSNYQILSLVAIPGEYSANYTYMNRLRFTYVVVDISTFFITPVTKNHDALWISGQLQVYVTKDFEPNADQKCMLGIKSYMLVLNTIENYSISVLNSTNYSLIYLYKRIPGNNIVPSLFCFGYCEQGTGRSADNVCSACPKQSLTCSNTSYALTCLPGLYPQITVIGFQKCLPCMPACRICTNYSYCIECQPTNLPTQKNSCQKCVNNSRLAGGICSSVPGCSRAQSVGGKSVCRFCSPQEYFQIDPIDQMCICKSGYQLKDGKCIDYCGDGIIIDLECDDNNTANNDGCSSECRKQIGYECSNKTTNSSSECRFIERVSIELISIERVNLQNKIILVFRVLPPQLKSLSSQFIKGSLSTNLSVRLESVTVEARFITAQAIFDQDIQGKQAILTINFNDPSVIQKQVSLLIRFKSDGKLVKLQRIQLAKTIKYIFSSAILCVILIFLVSLRFHKTIGLETILPFQIIYFVFLLSRNKTQLFSLFQYYSGSALNFFYYFNGQSFIQLSFSNNSLISNNQKFSMIFIFCLSYSAFSLSLIGLILHFLRDKKSICNQKAQRFITFWHNRISFPLFSWFLVPLLIFQSAVSISNSELGFNRPMLVLQCHMMILVICYQWRGAFSVKSSFVQPISNHHFYIPLLLGFLLIVSFILSASFIGLIPFVEPWIFCLFSLGLLGFIYVRPYKKVIHNAGVIVGMVQTIFFLGWGIFRTDPSVQTEEKQIFGLLICFSLATANIIIGIVRVFSEAVRQCHQISNKPTLVDFSVEKEHIGNLQARFETIAIIPQHLNDRNARFVESPPLQHFNPSLKQKNPQIKRYLMQKMKVTKNIKYSIKY